MSALHENKGRRLPDSPLYSWLGILVFGVFAVWIVIMFWVSYHAGQWHEADRRKWMNWPATPGAPIDTRITDEPITDSTFRGIGKRGYVGECLVAYSVAGRRYSVWVEANRTADLVELTTEMRTCPYSSYTVHYDPQQPSSSHVFFAGLLQR